MRPKFILLSCVLGLALLTPNVILIVSLVPVVTPKLMMFLISQIPGIAYISCCAAEYLMLPKVEI